jgi:hypothetical protein
MHVARQQQKWHKIGACILCYVAFAGQFRQLLDLNLGLRHIYNRSSTPMSQISICPFFPLEPLSFSCRTRTNGVQQRRANGIYIRSCGCPYLVKAFVRHHDPSCSEWSFEDNNKQTWGVISVMPCNICFRAALPCHNGKYMGGTMSLVELSMWLNGERMLLCKGKGR